MKSYARFKKDLTEAVPLAAPLLAPLVPKILLVQLRQLVLVEDHQATKRGVEDHNLPITDKWYSNPRTQVQTAGKV